MSARWEETLDHQIDLLKSLHSEGGRRYVEGWAMSVAGGSDGETATGWVDAHGTPMTRLGAGHRRAVKSMLHDLPDQLSTQVFNADPIYVDPDVMTIIEGASQTFEPEPLQPTDLITEAGFMWLPRPIRMRDIHDKVMTYRAILWHPMRFQYVVSASDSAPAPKSGVYLTLFHYAGDPDDYVETDRMVKAIDGGDIHVAHVAPWLFGEGYLGPDVNARADAGMWGVAKVVQCAWRLMLQTLAVRSEERPSGPFRKRWERANMPEKRVTVVRLRRPETPRDPDAEHHSVEWTHRWLVGGHWRMQPYPSLGISRQIWISPYVKGPSDKELVVRKSRVFEFVR